jgi:hypothetical protein
MSTKIWCPGECAQRTQLPACQIFMFKPLADTDSGFYFAFLIDPPGISHCPRAGPRYTINNLWLFDSLPNLVSSISDSYLSQSFIHIGFWQVRLINDIIGWQTSDRACLQSYFLNGSPSDQGMLLLLRWRTSHRIENLHEQNYANQMAGNDRPKCLHCPAPGRAEIQRLSSTVLRRLCLP